MFQCKNLKDYLHVYLLTNCLLLADVFENYRDCCLADYRLDPVHYYSSPHFTFDAFLLFSRAKLDFLTEVDQYLFLNKAMWGGLSMVAKCHSKANHPSLTDCDSSHPCRFLMFLDTNNLYSKAMMDTLNKEKLLTTFETRRHYVLHYRNLKLYSSLGLVVSEVHGDLVFRQALVMRDYVQFNSLCHSQAWNDFDLDFYKLFVK